MLNAEKPQKKQPQRRCTGCGQSFPKNQLLRVVRSPEGEISLDAGGKKSGRGAYICRNAACLKKARKGKRLEHSLECVIDDALYDRLEAEIAAYESK